MNTNVETVTELHDCILMKHLLRIFFDLLGKKKKKKEIVNMHPNPVNVFPLLLEHTADTVCFWSVSIQVILGPLHSTRSAAQVSLFPRH